MVPKILSACLFLCFASNTFADDFNNIKATKVVQTIKTTNKYSDTIITVIDCTNGLENCTHSFVKRGMSLAVETVAIPTAVGIASATGMTASTGTAISALSGVAATNATLAAIGTPVAGGLATLTGIAVAPAVAGAAVVIGAGTLLGMGVDKLLFSDDSQ
jgi:hypothetical protein